MATSEPRNAIYEVAGPERMTFADLARTVLARQGRDLDVVTDPTATYFGHPIDDLTLVPRHADELGVAPLGDWLAGS